MKAFKSLAAAAALTLVGTTSAFAYQTYVPMDAGLPGVFDNTWTLSNSTSNPDFGGGKAGTTFDDFFTFNVPDTESISFSVTADHSSTSPWGVSFLSSKSVGGWALFVLADGTLLGTENAKIPRTIDSDGSFLLTSGTYVLEIAGKYAINNGTYSGYIDGIPQVTSVPEPATWALLLAGTGIVGGIARRRAGRA